MATQLIEWDRKSNPHQPHSYSAAECESQVRAAIGACVRTFNASQPELRDLPKRFWVALLDLEMAVDESCPEDELRESLAAAYKQLGAPGDFGYGTPHGDALRNLYDWWAAWTVARKHEATTA